MDCRIYILILALGALLISSDAAPANSTGEEPNPKQSRHGLRAAHRLRARGNTKQTVDDALNIPIVALEAVQRLLSNLFT